MGNFYEGFGSTSTKNLWESPSLGQSGSQSPVILQHIGPGPAGPYPDISLAGSNPVSVAATERNHESKGHYLLGRNETPSKA